MAGLNTVLIVATILLQTICLYHTDASQSPNIIFILADDLGWNDISFHGSNQIPTPNIDTLAYDGIILHNYYVQPICTPTRAALLTGRFPIHTGLQHGVLTSSQPYGLGLHEKLLPELLGELDYSNHIVGKWHLGFFAKEYTPMYRGFESHYGYYQGMEDYYQHNYWADGRTPETDGFDFRDGMQLDRSATGKYSTEIYTSRAEHIIQQHNTSKPLFMYLAQQAVHSADVTDPLQAPARYFNKFPHIKNKKRRTFAGMVAALDDSIGNVTKALAAKGMLDNTVIAFSTDNGGPVNGFDMNAASNWPLRGCKNTLWEGGTRGAGFIWSPLLQKHNYISNHMMNVVDWYPTLLSIAKYNMSKLNHSVDGMDMWNTLSTHQKRSPRTEFVYNIDDKRKIAAFRMRNMKVVVGESYNGAWSGWFPPWQTEQDEQQEMSSSTDHNPQTVKEHNQQENSLVVEATMDLSSEEPPKDLFKSDLPDLFRVHLNRIVTQGHTPAVVRCGQKPANASTNCQPNKSPCLFDVEKDPCEYNNLAALMPHALEEILARLQQYNATVVPPRNKPVDPQGLPVNHDGSWVPWVNLTHISYPLD